MYDLYVVVDNNIQVPVAVVDNTQVVAVHHMAEVVVRHNVVVAVVHLRPAEQAAGWSAESTALDAAALAVWVGVVYVYLLLPLSDFFRGVRSPHRQWQHSRPSPGEGKGMGFYLWIIASAAAMKKCPLLCHFCFSNPTNRI